MDGVSPAAAFAAVHRPQLTVSGVPERFWSTLYKKLSEQIFDAGDAFSLLRIDYGDSPKRPEEPAFAVSVVRAGGVSPDDPTQIYLVDHAWTFRPHDASARLRTEPALVARLAAMFGLERDSVDEVLGALWRYARFYSVDVGGGTPEDRLPVWYVTDELGSSLHHSDEPNFRCVPFVRLPDGDAYGLLFATRPVSVGEFATCDFVENVVDGPHRRALLTPWLGFDDDDADADLVRAEPGPEYFASGRVDETLPVGGGRDPNRRPKLRVYSEYARIDETLTDPAFEIVAEESSADVLWYAGHFKAYRELSETSPSKFVNQFPFESVITIKDLLAVVARRSADDSGDPFEDRPRWLPNTFNLRTELREFLAHFRRRTRAGLDNVWIVKPFNLARGLDAHVTDDANLIARLALTGPKIAQKYVENPCTFLRRDLNEQVKFDVRYVILLKSVRPLRVYVYRNFFLRFANKRFALSDFNDYERHFTVMNYLEEGSLFRMLCADFVTEWNTQYDAHPWSSIEDDIVCMLRSLFECATAEPPPCGIAPNGQSRALYAADILLAWGKDSQGDRVVQPKLLEVNWMPDCNRACEYYPDFYNDVFSLLFLDREPESCRRVAPL